MCYIAGESTYCNPYCHEGYEFSYKPKGTYFCYQSKWQYWKGKYQVKMVERENWPNCVGKCIVCLLNLIGIHFSDQVSEADTHADFRIF